jgi:hypothetical protein
LLKNCAGGKFQAGTACIHKNGLLKYISALGQAAGALCLPQNHPAFPLSALSTSRQGWGITELNSEFAAASPNDTALPFDAFA